MGTALVGAAIGAAALLAAYVYLRFPERMSEQARRTRPDREYSDSENFLVSVRGMRMFGWFALALGIVSVGAAIWTAVRAALGEPI